MITFLIILLLKKMMDIFDPTPEEAVIEEYDEDERGEI